MDISNGRGIGVALFVQGCHFHCQGCFNQETWDFDGGKEWTQDVEERFLRLVNRPYIKRISILGGEPLADENKDAVFAIIEHIRRRYPGKEIWLYTGYLWDDIYINNRFDLTKRLIAANCDYVVDGRFELSKQDLYNEKIVFAGSTNQRIIDVRKTLESGNIVCLKTKECTNDK